VVRNNFSIGVRGAAYLARLRAGVRVIIDSPLILAFFRKGRRKELTCSADQKWYRTGSSDIERVNKFEEQL
jgi:hypothetical protein